MKKNIYTLNVIHASIEDTVCLDTYAFNTIEEAMEKFKTEEKEWIQGFKKREVEENGMTEAEFEKWLLDAIDVDMQHAEGLYKSYIYCDGDEKIFAIEKHEIDITVI